MISVLITGAKGFLGKNLILELRKNTSLNIMEFVREDDAGKLRGLIVKSDFIFHFAGEVRPDSSDDAFIQSNANLTGLIIQIIERANKKIPILLASSIHSESARNEYGKTKRQSEILIEKYANKNNVDCYIYKLSHVFGEGCKPNYNSAISTWIYNVINDLEVVVYDRGIEMNYIYVQDLIIEFIDAMNMHKKGGYLKSKYAHQTNLGEVVDFIKEFKENENNSNYSIGSNEFKNKLFLTYKSYLN